MLDVVANVLMVLTFFASVVFVVRYAWTTWERHADGRYQMMLSVAVMLVSGWLVADLVVDDDHPARPAIRTTVWTIAFVALVWRDVVLFRAQREKKAIDDERHDTGPGS